MTTINIHASLASLAKGNSMQLGENVIYKNCGSHKNSFVTKPGTKTQKIFITNYSDVVSFCLCTPNLQFLVVASI